MVVRAGTRGVGDAMATRGRSYWVSAPLTALAVVCAGGAFVTGVTAGAAHGVARLLLIGLGVLLTGAGIVLAAIERSRSERARRTAEHVALDAEHDLTLALNGALAPITCYLAELADTGQAQERLPLGGQIRQAVVDAAVKLTAPAARSAFYPLGGGDLVRDAYAGRSTLPRERFEADSADGRYVLGLVADGALL